MNFDKFINGFVDNLSDDELSSLYARIWDEKRKRDRVKVHNNEYPPLLDEEKALARANKKNEAIKSYLNRTQVSVSFAVEVIDYYLEKYFF